MAQIATTAVQAAPLYLYSFIVITSIAFECIDVLQIVGTHHLTGGKLWVGIRLGS